MNEVNPSWIIYPALVVSALYIWTLFFGVDRAPVLVPTLDAYDLGYR